MAKQSVWGGGDMQMLMWLMSQQQKGGSNILNPSMKFQNSIASIFTRMGTDPTYPGEDNKRLTNIGAIIQEFHDMTVKRNPIEAVGLGMINEEAQNTIQAKIDLNDEYDEFNTNYLTGGEVTNPSTSEVEKTLSFQDKVMTGFNEARQLSDDLLDKDNIDVTTDEGKAKIRDLNSRTVKWQDDWLDIMQQQDTYLTKIMPKFQKRSNYATEIALNIANTDKVIKSVWDEMKGKTLFNQEEHKAIQEGHTTKNWKSYADLETRQVTKDQSVVSELQTKINQTAKQIQTIENAIALDKGRVKTGAPTDDFIMGFKDQNVTLEDANEIIEDYKLDIIQLRTLMMRSGETYPHTKFEDIKEEAALYPAPEPEIEPEEPEKPPAPTTTVKQDKVLMQQFKISPVELDSNKVAFAKQDKHKTLEAFISAGQKGADPVDKTKKLYEGYAKDYDTTYDTIVKRAEDFKKRGTGYSGSFLNYLEDLKDEGKLETGEKVTGKPDKKELTADNLSNEYTKVYKPGFNRTPEGKAFEKKYGINNTIMNKLSEIENTKGSASPDAYKQKAIDRKKADIDRLLEKVVVKSKKDALDNATFLVKNYANKKKVSTEDIELIKSAIPNIDEIIAAYQSEKKVASKYGSGITFWGFLEDNKEYKESVDYEKLAGLF